MAARVPAAAAAALPELPAIVGPGVGLCRARAGRENVPPANAGNAGIGWLLKEQVGIRASDIAEVLVDRVAGLSMAVRGILEAMLDPPVTGEVLEIPGARTDRGRFKAGISGNPAGRPKGSRNRVTELARNILDGSAEELVEKLVELARSGDRLALRLVIDRVIPARRDRCVELEHLRSIGTAGELIEASGMVIREAAAGHITLEEARAFMALLEQQRKSIESAELSIRVQALEQRLTAEEDDEQAWRRHR